MKNKENAIKKELELDTFGDVTQTATMLSADISKFLGEELEELNISSYLFRSGMERCLTRVLMALLKNTQPVAIFPDSVPGFTMMVFRKTAMQLTETQSSVKTKRNPTEEMNQSQAIDSVVGKFFEKNKQKVLIIENKDMIFSLFPVSDTKKNLKELDLYITY